MSGPPGVEDYVVFFTWIGIASIYITLLTVTALAVLFLLRKRRSSILKSQRPPRTPFSELEFNVATPTDTAKSRRVSFSSRTGVAEFVKNEGTTTWTNFYEEHNKSLESSGNQTAANPRLVIEHIGKRIFDQQFEEVEVIDIGGALQSNTNQQTSINNVNVSHELNTDKLIEPIRNFELSSMTDHQSRIFGDELSVPLMTEMSNPININFSNLNSIGDKCDDLEEIERDLERSQNNIVCPGPFTGRDMSEYIEMSITETIQTPNVQTAPKSDFKETTTDDWIVDKENIIVNPYIAPMESKNFTLKPDDKILVFDGKKLTVQSERESILDLDEKEIQYRGLISNNTATTPQRKTIFLDVNDDLPNFVQGTLVDNYQNNNQTTKNFDKPKRKTIVFDEDGDISVTQAIPSKVLTDKEKTNTTIYDNDNNLSITQAVIKNFDNPKRKTIVFDEGADISITQALPSKVLIDKDKNNATVYDNDNNLSITQAGIKNFDNPKRKTIVFDEDADLSITQALPSKVLIGKKKNNATIYDNDNNLSITQAGIKNFDNPKRKTIVFDEGADISITQAIPSKVLIEKKKRNTIIFNNDNNLSLTQAIPSNIINDKHKTIVYEDDNILYTQVQDNLMMNNKNKTIQDKTMIYQNDIDISITQAIPLNIIKNNEIDNDCDVTMTEAIPSKIITTENMINGANDTIHNMNLSNENDKGRTVFDDKLSITKAISNLLPDKHQEIERVPNRKTVYDNDISMTLAMPSNIIQPLNNDNVDINDISVNRALATNVLVDTEENGIFSTKNNNGDLNIDITTKNITETIQNICINSNVSITKPIPSNLLDLQGDILKNNRKTLPNKTDRIIEENNHDVLVYQAKESITLAQLKNMVNNENENVAESSSVISVPKELDKTNIYGICGVPMIEDKMVESEVEVDAKAETSEVKKPLTSASFTIRTSPENGHIKKSLLNELLDMSCSSLDVLAEPKLSFKLANEMEMQIKESYEDTNNMKKNSVEDKEFVENQLLSIRQELIPQVTSTIPALKYQEDSEDLHHLPNQIDNLKVEGEITSNRHYEKMISSDLQQSLEQLNTSDKEKNISRSIKKSFKHADDTNELLEMLSDFTDGPTEKEKEGEEDKEDKEQEKKSEPKRLSFAPNRQSIVLSREDLLNNISMAHAALKHSRFEIDDSDEDVTDYPEEETQDEKKSPRKSVRMSTEVVKTLQFDADESISESSVISEIKVSPLKKTAFGEVSYMQESKAKVIPSYLKDVSDNIKALMTDLVKPVTDAMPFETGMDKTMRKSSSTCSTQIQANLQTSSQIDMDVELNSNTESLHSSKPSQTMVKEIASMGNKAISQALKQTIKHSTNVTFEANKAELPESESKKPLPRKSGPVIVFDHSNPLNNILLSQPDNIKVHRYNPIPSSEAMDTEYSSSNRVTNKIEGQCEIERISTCYNLETKNQSMQSGDAGSNIQKVNSTVSNMSKPLSIDRSIEGFALQVKDTEVNTLIAMKETKEILDANSSLTLVDDALGHSEFDLHLKTSSEIEARKQRSPVKVIYKMEHDELAEKIYSDLTSMNDPAEDEFKSKKRTYSPTKRDKNKNTSHVDVTPKPVSKIQKMSNSPNLVTLKTERKKSPKSRSSPDKQVKSKVSPRKEELMSHIQEVPPKNIIEAINCSTTTVAADTISHTLVRSLNSPETGSYTSGCAAESQDLSSAESRSISVVGSNISRINWQPDLVNELSSKNMIEECNSGDNVVAKINTLPFMGTRDCEWESSTSDVWTFRLLRSRIRLIVRLAHTHHNASRSRVRADTSIVALNVDSILEEDSDPLASLVIRLSRDAMRAACARCVSARDVPQLLRSCVGVARVAPRWGRAMRDARVRLAYRIGSGGELAFKVANIQLRSVWEVRMRIKLVVDDNLESWPCASDVRVCAVLADQETIPDVERITRTLKRDWGHAPATIWKIFKYLKNKTRGEDILGL